MVPALHGDELARAIGNGLGERGPLNLDHAFKGWDFAGTSVVTPTNMLKDFDTWYPSRALWDDMPDPADPATPQRRYTITEFPFFSFWLGDMHPHVMALPFGLLALALALQTVARRDAPRFARGRRGWLELAITGIVLGSLYAINSWDFPTYLLLFWGALLLLHVRLASRPRHEDMETRREGGTETKAVTASSVSTTNLGVISSPRLLVSLSPHLEGLRQYFLQISAVMLASLVMFLPFHLTFHSLVGSKAPLINVPLLGGLTRTIGFVTWDKTSLHTFFIIFGLFLVPLLSFIGMQAAHVRDSRALLWITLAALPVGLLIGFPLLFLLPLAVYAIMLAAVQNERPAMAFVLWAFALACLISFGTEVVYLRDVFEARMNTIFKFYYQVWLIWGVLAGYAVWWLLAEQRTKSAEQESPRPSSSVVRRLSLALVGVIFAVLLASALIYPWETAGRALLNDTRVGLAGKTPRQNTPAGEAAIDWLRAHAPADAVVLEVVGGDYDGSLGSYPGGLGAGGVSASTGLQNIINWPGHENQWRPGDPTALAVLGERQADVDTIYSTMDVTQARALLQKYHVKYVYVGAAERAAYPPESLAKFSQLGTPVFQQGDVVIYEVK
jgi:YYY domain-containing protein